MMYTLRNKGTKAVSTAVPLKRDTFVPIGFKYVHFKY